MLLRLITRLFAAFVLLAGVWSLTRIKDPDSILSIRPIGASRGPVRITQFYATSGMIQAGERTRLCYGVENAKSVHISPLLSGVYPASNRCVEIVPEHTTHYALMAEGYDGRTATRFFTLVVQPSEESPRPALRMVSWEQ